MLPFLVMLLFAKVVSLQNSNVDRTYPQDLVVALYAEIYHHVYGILISMISSVMAFSSV